ncbi:hypothetical protein, partial [Georgenia thermotolerans]
RDRAGARLRAALGPGAQVHELPGGGVAAETPGRRAAVALTDLADRALDGLGADLAGLWAP